MYKALIMILCICGSCYGQSFLTETESVYSIVLDGSPKEISYA